MSSHRRSTRLRRVVATSGLAFLAVTAWGVHTLLDDDVPGAAAGRPAAQGAPLETTVGTSDLTPQARPHRPAPATHRTAGSRPAPVSRASVAGALCVRRGLLTRACPPGDAEPAPPHRGEAPRRGTSPRGHDECRGRVGHGPSGPHPEPCPEPTPSPVPTPCPDTGPDTRADSCPEPGPGPDAGRAPRPRPRPRAGHPHGDARTLTVRTGAASRRSAAGSALAGARAGRRRRPARPTRRA